MEVEQQPTVEEIVQNPDAFFVRAPGDYMPPWEGIMLAWLVKELRQPEDLFLIDRIRVCHEDGYAYYRFDPRDFIYQSGCDYDDIEELHTIGLDRLEMSNGCFYQFEPTDGEYYQDQFSYHVPVPKDHIIRDNFCSLLREGVDQKNERWAGINRRSRFKEAISKSVKK